ncbi:MAG: prephenate dehydrogenase/arogenate dehydrogenase family protein [Steroidobacteraceae bacterium]
MNLAELRGRLTEIDRRLLELVAERQALAGQIAEVKRATGYPTRDYQREKEVLLAARTTAVELGVAPDVAESILTLLIRTSLATQEQAKVSAEALGSGKSALVIGGAGKMGRWFVDFMASQGFGVEVADPAGGVAGHRHRADWQSGALDHDLIVVATPLGITDSILIELAGRRPAGVIFDLGSLKTPLRRGLKSLIDAGCQVTSVHPMFGPATDLLSGRHVIFIDLGAAAALAQAQALFSSTMAERVVMDLDQHDRLIAYVLGLSHALNIAFFCALAASGEAAPRLAQLSSTTFDAQLEVATLVASESPQLYFEIQSLNDYGANSLDALAQAVDRLREVVRARNETSFIDMMRTGREYLAGRTAGRRPAAPGS